MDGWSGRRPEAEELAGALADGRREIEGLEALLADRDRRLRELRAELTEARLHRLWLDSEVARRDARIGELLSGHDGRGAIAGLLGRARRWVGRLRGRWKPGGEVPPQGGSGLAGPGPHPPGGHLLPGGEGRESSWGPPAPAVAGGPGLAVVKVGESSGIGAEGDYLVFVDEGWGLAPGALGELSRGVVEGGWPDLVYGDGSGREGSVYRPGWSPEFLLSTMYLGGVVAIRRDRFEGAGGFREEFEGAELHELCLRVTEGESSRVWHVPRAVGESRTGPRRMTPEEASRGARGVAEALARRGVEGAVSRTWYAVREGLGVYEIDFPESGPLVSIVVPTKDRPGLLRRCVESVLSRTSYEDFRLVVVDNDSEEEETLAYLESLPGMDPRCVVGRVSNDGEPFSYARVNNRAVERLGADSGFVVFLNNDTEVVRPEWLGQLVGYARMPGVGACGARLLFPDGRLQHAGMLTDVHEGLPGHAFKLCPWWYRGPLGQAVAARNCSALTAACLLVGREEFLGLGGFDESNFKVAFNDVDLCLRLNERGRRCVYAPRAELLHYEGATRGFGDDPSEAEAYVRAWGSRRDPYRNPNLPWGDERLSGGG